MYFHFSSNLRENDHNLSNIKIVILRIISTFIFQKMKLLAAVIAASASAEGHGDHSYSTTTSPYPQTTPEYHMGDHYEGSGGHYHDEDHYNDHEKPDMDYGNDRPNMSCNQEAMKMWKMEMEKWKYQQEGKLLLRYM